MAKDPHRGSFLPCRRRQCDPPVGHTNCADSTMSSAFRRHALRSPLLGPACPTTDIPLVVAAGSRYRSTPIQPDGSHADDPARARRRADRHGRPRNELLQVIYRAPPHIINIIPMAHRSAALDTAPWKAKLGLRHQPDFVMTFGLLTTPSKGARDRNPRNAGGGSKGNRISSISSLKPVDAGARWRRKEEGLSRFSAERLGRAN